VACGSLRATYLRLGSLRVRPGAVVAAGYPLGVLGAAGRLRLGARHAGRRFGYVDPLTLLRTSRAPPPLAIPAPRSPRPPRAVRSARAPAPAPREVPAAGWLAVALLAGGLPVGGLVRGRRRARRRATAREVRAARL
jgi:hypothetical protein